MRMSAPMEVGICCRDVAALKQFYINALGFTEVSSIDVPAGKAGATGLTAGSYRVVRLQTPWGERMKLLQPERPPAPRQSEASILSLEGTAYFTFIVDDLDSILEVLRARGVELLSGDSTVEVRPGVFLVFARDPEGNILEFVEYADIAAYRPDLHK